MFENIINFFKKLTKTEERTNVTSSKETAKERLHLVLMQDRANMSADFLELMKQEIIEVIKKYIDVEEELIDVRLKNKIEEDGSNGSPFLYANIPIVNIRDEVKKEKEENNKEEVSEKEADEQNTEKEVEADNSETEKEENKNEEKAEEIIEKKKKKTTEEKDNKEEKEEQSKVEEKKEEDEVEEPVREEKETESEEVAEEKDKEEEKEEQNKVENEG